LHYHNGVPLVRRRRWRHCATMVTAISPGVFTDVCWRRRKSVVRAQEERKKKTNKNGRLLRTAECEVMQAPANGPSEGTFHGAPPPRAGFRKKTKRLPGIQRDVLRIQGKQTGRYHRLRLGELYGICVQPVGYHAGRRTANDRHRLMYFAPSEPEEGREPAGLGRNLIG